jgi:hypothetical protein
MILGSSAGENPTKLTKKISHIYFIGRHVELIFDILQAKVSNSPFSEDDPHYILASFNLAHATKSSESTLIGNAVAFTLRPVAAFLVFIPAEVALKVEGATTAVYRLSEPHQEQGRMLFDASRLGDKRDH